MCACDSFSCNLLSYLKGRLFSSNRSLLTCATLIRFYYRSFTSYRKRKNGKATQSLEKDLIAHPHLIWFIFLNSFLSFLFSHRCFTFSYMATSLKYEMFLAEEIWLNNLGELCHGNICTKCSFYAPWFLQLKVWWIGYDGADAKIGLHFIIHEAVKCNL